MFFRVYLLVLCISFGFSTQKETERKRNETKHIGFEIDENWLDAHFGVDWMNGWNKLNTEKTRRAAVKQETWVLFWHLAQLMFHQFMKTVWQKSNRIPKICYQIGLVFGCCCCCCCTWRYEPFGHKNQGVDPKNESINKHTRIRAIELCCMLNVNDSL